MGLMNLDHDQFDFFLGMARRPRDPIFPGPTEIRRWGQAGEELVYSYIEPEDVRDRPSLRQIQRYRHSLAVVLTETEEVSIQALSRLGTVRYFELIRQMGGAEDRLESEAWLLKMWIDELNRLFDKVSKDGKNASPQDLQDLEAILLIHPRFDWDFIYEIYPSRLDELKDFIMPFYENVDVSVGQEAEISAICHGLVRNRPDFKRELLPILDELDEVLRPSGLKK
jgi:hypothetical protein